MIPFALAALCMIIAGHALSQALWRRAASVVGPPLAFERAASSLTMAMALWIALDWSLALPKVFTAPAFLGGAIVIGGAGGAALFVRWRRAREASPSKPTTASTRIDVPSRVLWITAAALFPIVLWVAFIVWRSSILPVLNHDALSYHMPKAVMLMREQGFAMFDGPDTRMATTPANYELLLANVLQCAGVDDDTEIVGTMGFVLFLIFSAAMLERWWGRGVHLLASTLVIASMPVVLLHTGAHKNDLLATAFFLGTLVWSARWAVRPSWPAFVLAVVSAGLSVGTKLHGLFVVGAVAPAVVWGAIRHVRASGMPSSRSIAGGVALCVASVLLLGGYVPIASVLQAGGLAPHAEGFSGPRYGDWSNLATYPFLLFTAPFSPNPAAVWVPWRHEYWFWPKYDLFFSHYGVAVSLLLAATPLGIVKLRKLERDGASGVRVERIIASLAAVAIFFLVAPIVLRPIGFFAAFPRYTLIVVTVIAGWTVSPALAILSARGDGAARAAIAGVTVGAALVFGVEAISVVRNDNFIPMSYVAELVRQPEIRREIFIRRNRAAQIVDHIADPDATIAVHGSYDTWIYPAFGKDFRRKLLYLHPVGEKVAIPDDAEWVIVDRSWNCFWGHPDFKDFGQVRLYLSRGSPTAQDLVVYKQLAVDPRFEEVYRDKRDNQAVFQRIAR